MEMIDYHILVLYCTSIILFPQIFRPFSTAALMWHLLFKPLSSVWWWYGKVYVDINDSVYDILCVKIWYDDGWYFDATLLQICWAFITNIILTIEYLVRNSWQSSRYIFAVTHENSSFNSLSWSHWHILLHYR